MKPNQGVLITAAFLMALTSQTLARPEYGGNCAGCHGPSGSTTPGGLPGGSIVTGQMSLSGTVGSTDPGTGALPTYQVTPGSTVTFTDTILNGSAFAYSVAISGFELGGVQNSANHLTLPGSQPTGWVAQTGSQIPGPTYFSTSLGLILNHSTPTLTFAYTVPANTPADFYNLTFKMAGLSASFAAFAEEDHFYLNVVSPVPEPQAYAMVAGLGLLGFGAFRRWMKKTQKN